MTFQVKNIGISISVTSPVFTWYWLYTKKPQYAPWSSQCPLTVPFYLFSPHFAQQSFRTCREPVCFSAKTPTSSGGKSVYPAPLRVLRGITQESWSVGTVLPENHRAASSTGDETLIGLILIPRNRGRKGKNCIWEPFETINGSS